MGSPLSPVVANIFMEAFEKEVLDSAPLKPKCWFRYIDDTFIIWPHGRNTLTDFLTHLNAHHPDIQFTMEIESNGQLPFLDVLVTRLPNRELGHSVYRKPTHTNRYLNALSHHHPSQKQSVINSLVHRAVTLSEPDSLPSELVKVTDALTNNGYNKRDIQRTITRFLEPDKIRQTKNTTTSSTTTAYLPYIKNVTDRISKILRKHDIRTSFNAHRKLSECLPSVKDSLPLQTKGIYKIPCTCGKVYIGETRRTIKTRISEHERDTRLKHITQSALAEHKHDTGHNIKFAETEVISRTSRYYPRKIREAIEIFKNPNNINRDNGYPLHNSWKRVITRRLYAPAPVTHHQPQSNINTPDTNNSPVAV